MYNNQDIWRITIFCACLVALLCAEWLWPNRKRRHALAIRWSRNGWLLLLGVVASRLMMPFGLIGVALTANAYTIGIFYTINWLTTPITVIASVVLLDCAIYWQHRLFHALPWLWRVHKIHHVDQEMDVTTAVRFHPIEMMLSIFIKSCIILLLGAPVLAVIIFEILLSSLALFNHANIRLPKKLDAILRAVVVTPSMHLIHHSTRMSETNSNYGFAISWWDRLFNSYTATPKNNPTTMPIGLADCQNSAKTQLYRLLLLRL